MKLQKYSDKDLTVVSSVFQFLQTSYYSFLRAENNTLTEHLRREIRFGLRLEEIKNEGETVNGTETIYYVCMEPAQPTQAKMVVEWIQHFPQEN